MSGGSGALEAYLTDHMADSVSAGDLAKRGAKNNDGPMQAFFAGLGRRSDIDRRTLDAIGSKVGVQPHPLKQAGAVAAERLSRFKIDHRMTNDPQLSLLLELELLYLGIQGKQVLWRTLQGRSQKRPAAGRVRLRQAGRPGPGAARRRRGTAARDSADRAVGLTRTAVVYGQACRRPGCSQRRACCRSSGVVPPQMP